MRKYVSRIKIAVLSIFCFSATLNGHVFADTPATILPFNSANIIIVPAYSTLDNSNNLSVDQFNRSLIFAQMIPQMTGAPALGVYAALSATVSSTSPTPSLAPLETVEPYAVLSQTSVNAIQPPTGNNYGTLLGTIRTIIENLTASNLGNSSFYGNYVISADRVSINNALGILNYSLKDESDFMVISFSLVNGVVTKTVNQYKDNIPTNSNYPVLMMPPQTSTCTFTFQTFATIAPPGSTHPITPVPSRTAYFVRHVEAHPTVIVNGTSTTLENGNYVSQGQWRAVGAVNSLYSKMDISNKFIIYSVNPLNIINNETTNQSFNYVRPSMTIAPFAIKNKMPINIANFAYNEPSQLAAALFNPVTGNNPFGSTGKDTILVAWEHGNLHAAVQDVVQSIYQSSDVIPKWPGDDYDSIWMLSTDPSGNLTINLGACEGYNTATLPTQWPNFPPPAPTLVQ